MAAEALVIRLAHAGLNAVVVNPSMCVGEFDTKPSTGEFFRFFAKSPFSAMAGERLNIVDVEDVALGIAFALERGKVGERYILSGTNTTIGSLLSRIRQLSGRRMPRVSIPRSVVVGAALLSELANVILRRPSPALPLLGVELIEQGSQHLSCAKAARELGYAPRDAWQAVDRAYRWYDINRLL
jgi:dihydroflavonol-4-reductase